VHELGRNKKDTDRGQKNINLYLLVTKICLSSEAFFYPRYRCMHLCMFLSSARLMIKFLRDPTLHYILYVQLAKTCHLSICMYAIMIAVNKAWLSVGPYKKYEVMLTWCTEHWWYVKFSELPPSPYIQKYCRLSAMMMWHMCLLVSSTDWWRG